MLLSEALKKELNNFIFWQMMLDAPAVEGELDLHLKRLHSFIFSLVVALESFGHEQLPEVLRGEFLHVLAVVVNLPCWRGAACIHTPPYNTTHTPPVETYVQTHTHTNVHVCTNRRRRERKQQHNIKLVVSRVNGGIRMLSGGGELNAVKQQENRRLNGRRSQ